MSCVNPVTNVRNAALNPPVGASLQNFWQTWLDLGAGPKVVQILKEGYTLPFQDRLKLTRSPTVISCYVNPHRNSYLMEALHQLIDKNAVELVQYQTSLGFFNRLFLVPKPNNKWRPILDLSKLNLFLKVEKFKMETPETIRTSLPSGRLLPYPYTGTVQEISEISCPRSDIPIQSTAFRSVHSTLGVYCRNKGGETDGHTQGYKDPPIPRLLVGERGLSPAYSRSSESQELGWLVNLEKSELEPKRIFDFVGYQFDLRAGRVRPTPDRWQSLQDKIVETLSLPSCPVRQFMSLIGLLTATEKQVHLGRLHIRPIQGHLKNNWRVPESLEKVIPIPRSMHPHVQWWLSKDNVLTGQTLHPIKHAQLIFTDASKEEWGAHLNERSARGSWSILESRLHINYLELKAVFLALKEFQDLCTNKIVLVATNNTTVVSYINKEGGMRLGPLCALLWRILTWCTRKQVTLKARHIPAERGSRQAIQARLNHPNRVVSPSRGLPDDMQQVAPVKNRPICHEGQQVASVCVTGTGSPGHSNRCSVCHGRIWMHMPSHQQPSWAKWWKRCRTPHARESL